MGYDEMKQIHVPDDVHKAIKKTATDRDTTISEIATQWLREAIEREQKERKRRAGDQGEV